MRNEELKDTPAYENAVHKSQWNAFQLVSDIFEGTEVVVSRGETYLPKEEKESKKAYEIRLKRATFYNAYKRTLKGLVGMVFRKNPVLSDEIDKEIQTHAENVDLQGNHLDVFSKDLLEKAGNHGHSLILVDMPPKLGQGATLADERAAGRRPYWTQYNKGQVLNFEWKVENGKPRLTQVSLKEMARERDGRFGEKTFPRFRVLLPGGYEIWEQRNKDEAPIRIDGKETSITEIPLVVVYTGKRGTLDSSPSLLDMAYQNLRHYRLTSDLDRILHKASVPIFWASGLSQEDGKKVEISPDTGLFIDENGAVGWAEIAGTSIDKAQQEILNVEGRMAALGLSVIAEQPKAEKTATESVMDYEAESSELSSWARSLEDGLEAAFDFHAQFMGAKPGNGGSVAVNRDFTQAKFDPQQLSMLSNMVAAGELHRRTLWQILQKAEVLPPDFNADKEDELLGDLNNV